MIELVYFFEIHTVFLQLKAFMNVEYSIIAHNASILISELSPYGNILDVCNKFRGATNKNLDEYIVMMITSQILLIIDHLHACNIIHADVKPDNFLVMRRYVEFWMPLISQIKLITCFRLAWSMVAKRSPSN
jgi:serine/threonine protein kinase